MVINESAVKLARDAREVSGSDVFVAGSIGPLGGPVKDRDAVFTEQAQLLEGRGVDLFMIETFYELDELLGAIAAVRSVSSLPIVALLTFDEDSQTLGGVSAEQAASALAELDVAAIGANHGAGLQAALRAIERMTDGAKPLAALPNVGLATLAGERVIFPHATPEYFAEFAAHARELGARIIGGCCGTTPVGIAAIRKAVDEGRSPRTQRVVREREIVVTAGEPEHESVLQRKLREGEFVVSVEIDPPRGGTADGMLDLARTLAGIRTRRRRRRERQPAGSRAHERPHRVGDDRAGRRAGDDPPPHAARRVDCRPRVDVARRPCRGDPQRAGGHRGST